MFWFDKFSRRHVNDRDADDHDGERSTTNFSYPLSMPSLCPPSEAFFHVIGSYLREERWISYYFCHNPMVFPSIGTKALNRTFPRFLHETNPNFIV